MNVAVPGKMLALQMLVMVGMLGDKDRVRGWVGESMYMQRNKYTGYERPHGKRGRRHSPEAATRAGWYFQTRSSYHSYERQSSAGGLLRLLVPCPSSSVPRFLSMSVCPHTLCVMLIKKKKKRF